jgi:hypothetical protein
MAFFRRRYDATGLNGSHEISLPVGLRKTRIANDNPFARSGNVEPPIVFSVVNDWPAKRFSDLRHLDPNWGSFRIRKLKYVAWLAKLGDLVLSWIKPRDSGKQHGFQGGFRIWNLRPA